MEGFEKARVKSLLDHFSSVEDMREPWRVTPPHARVSANDAVLLEEIATAREGLGDEESEQGGVIAALARLWHRL